MADSSRSYSSVVNVAHHMTIEVELSISAKGLIENDHNSLPSTMCVVFNQPFGRDWQEYSRTEVQHGTLDPQFQHKIKIPYCFEERQRLKFQMFDVEKSNRSLTKHEYLGKVECTLAQIVATNSFSRRLLLHGERAGELCIGAKEVSHTREELELAFSANQLKKPRLTFANLSPYLDILAANKSIIRRTTFVFNNRNPQWPKLSVPLRSLKNERGEYAQLTLQCYSYKLDGDPQLIGETQIHSRQLLEAPITFTLKKNNADKGEIVLTSSQMMRVHSFLEYISNGTNLHCTFAFDLSESNGNPRNPDSLHYIGPEPTLYEHAITAIGDVFQDYIRDEMFSLIGFGARSTPVLHELRVRQVDSVVRAYRACLESVQLGDSRSFASVIEQVIRTCKSCNDGDDYFVLFVLTDGDIADMPQTAKAIIEASEQPISIVFIGIGTADFPNMRQLEGESWKLGNGGKTVARDIVQFAPFGQFLANRDVSAASFYMTKHLLAAIPDQLVAYMKLKSILPRHKVIKQ